MLNGGRERMELKKLKKQDWSTSTYSGEVPKEIRWTHLVTDENPVLSDGIPDHP